MESELRGRVQDLVGDRFGEAARVDRVEPLAGDASTRRYARAWLGGEGAPATVVVMILSDRGVSISSDELGVFDDRPAELPYVNVHRFLAPLGVAVPELYVDASDGGLLILEDVGDLPLRNAAEGRPDSEVEELFRLAIDQLVILQVRGTQQRDDGCVAFRQSFDERLFNWEFEHFIEYGLPAGERDSPGVAVLRRHFREIAAYLDARPRYLNHRDYHGWNLHLHDGRMRVLDFQDALLAPPTYDLATLLGDRDTRDVVPVSLERRLLQYYADRWVESGGPAFEPDELRTEYTRCALQKAFKVVGRFRYLDEVKGKRGYLRYLPPTLRQIARLLDELPGGVEIRDILAPHFEELRS